MELKKQIVIVGGCIAAKEAATAIRDNDLSCDITIISSEDHLPYYRPMLSRAIGQDLVKSRLYLAPKSWYDENNIKLILDTTITSVVPDENIVISDKGDKYEYTELVIATGASNFVPISNATDINGVLTIREYDDVVKLRKLIPNVKNAIVVGSGLLGIETAWELKQMNIKVKLVEFETHLLPKQLDNEAADFLSEYLNEQGVEVLCNVTTDSILSDENNNVTALRCSSGDIYECDLLIFSTGIIPNIQLTKDSGIDTKRGIIVDKYMRTNIPNIYAAGDVAQNEYEISGIWVPAMEMGKVAGSNISGKKMEYAPAFTSTMLTAFDTKIFSIGKTSNEPIFDTETIIDPKKKFFKKLFAKDNALVGAILIGDISQGTRLAKHLGVISLEKAKELIE